VSKSTADGTLYKWAKAPWWEEGPVGRRYSGEKDQLKSLVLPWAALWRPRGRILRGGGAHVSISVREDGEKNATDCVDLQVAVATLKGGGQSGSPGSFFFSFFFSLP
jgi:hypothetical protein